MLMESFKNIAHFSVCRCCLTKGNHRDLNKEYYLKGQREVLMDVIMDCYNLFLSTDPRLTTQICEKCISRLQDAYSFRNLVLENEKLLLDALDHHKALSSSTEFVNVVFDPLVEEAELKSETKSIILDFDETEELDLNDIEDEDLVPGEHELLERFPAVKRLPTRDTLMDTCPVFYGHLEALKGKIIKTDTIKFQISTPTHRKTRKHTKKIISEKMAHAINTLTILENSNATVFKSKMRSGFPCFYCRKTFDNPKELRNHQKTHPKNQLFKLLTKYTADAHIVYADVTDLKCTICNEDINSVIDLKAHLVNAHNKKIYNEVTDRVIPFKLGNRESNFDCQICGLNFETFGAIDKHMNMHFKNYVCEQCGSGFITRHRLKVHTYLLHKKSSVISCECKKVFLNRHKYKIHYETVHKKIKKMRCAKCSEKFIDYFTRQRHMEEKHGVEPILYKCTECDRSFNRKYTLTCHFKRRHLVSKEVQCDLCPFMCFNKSELKEHMYKHGGDKSFVCGVCKKAFTRKKTLSVHMRGHNDTRYTCHICGEAFIQNWSFKSHLKMHTVDCGDL